MKVSDIVVWATVILIVGGGNLIVNYWFARLIFGRGVMKELLARSLVFALFMAIGAAILFAWFTRTAPTP